MAKFQLIPDDVDAVRLDSDFPVADGVTVTGGQWLVKHADGSFTAVDDSDFTAKYEPAAEPAPAPEPDPSAIPEQPVTI